MRAKTVVRRERRDRADGRKTRVSLSTLIRVHASIFFVRARELRELDAAKRATVSRRSPVSIFSGQSLREDAPTFRGERKQPGLSATPEFIL